MTHADIFVTILHEVTGIPESVLRKIVRDAKAQFPNNNCEEEVPEEEARRLLEKLRREKSGILNWVLEECKSALEDRRTQSRDMAGGRGKAHKQPD